MRSRFLLAVLVLAVLLPGCLHVYKLEVQQGNVITQEMIDKLKPGMSRSQVRFVMGNPLVTDLFHADRWDYYYYLRRSRETAGEAQHLTLFFKNDNLLKVQNDAPPKTSPAESAVKPNPAAGAVNGS
ncbi:MAG: outer membrane protein assembly factor BamE [Gammaproteobacteria bacterium]|nr:outer membrane protein assembly factor BamE [Gammaproteobacteria bacterium]